MSNSIEGRCRQNRLRQARRIFRVASAAVFIATGTVFGADTNLSDCNLASLTDALQSGGTVTLSSTNSCTFLLTNTITIQTNVTVVASSNTVRFQGNGSLPVFRIGSNVTDFRLNGATVAGGKSANGGGMFIESGATVMLSNCVFTANNAAGTNGTSGANGADHSNSGGNGGNGTSGSDGFGGAIYNKGILSAYYCRFQTNTAQGGNGGNGGNGGSGSIEGGNGGNGGNGAVGLGGAIYNRGALALQDCTFENNAALGGAGGQGGAGGSGPFPGLIGNGKAGGEGSGGAIYSTNSTGRVVVLNCTFSLNRARSGDSAAAGNDSNGDGNDGPRGKDSFGGALFNGEQDVRMTNATFFANTAQGGKGGDGGPGYDVGGNGGNGGNGNGGGIYNSGTNYILNCTLSQGGATGGANGLGGAGAFPGTAGTAGAARGGNVSNTRSFALKNSIVANASSGGNGYGSFTDGGNNISSDDSISLVSTNSLKNTDPLLGTLADNGGPTKTMTLLEGSQAIDAIPETNCIIAFDQRGFSRPYGNGCDIGAAERTPTFSIQGHVTENNIGLSNITVTINDQTAITGTNGFYFISNLQTNSYTVTPQPAGLFSPSSQPVPVPPDATNINFTYFGPRTAIARTNGQIRISFLELRNRTYRIQAATNLVSTNFMNGTNLISSNLTIWTTIATNTSSSSGVFQITETSVTNFQRRFFRMIRP